MLNKGQSIFLIVILVLGIIASAGMALYFLFFAGGGDPEKSQENDLDELDDSVENSTIPVLEGCADYTNEDSCNSYSVDIANNGNESCSDEGVNCSCFWNSGEGLCENVLNFTQNDSSTGEFVDLVANGLVLENLGCTYTANNTNSSCDIKITGTIKNAGSIKTQDSFLVHFLDSSEDFSLIEALIFEEEISPGSEKNLTVNYENVPADKYFVLFRIDPSNNINETDITNNQKSEVIEIY